MFPVRAMVPVSFGNVQVLAAVKTTVVNVPVYELSPLALGEMMIGSLVASPKVAGPFVCMVETLERD